LHLPLEDWTDTVYKAAIQAWSAKGMDYYIAILDHYRARVAGIMRAIAQAPAGGVLVHCTAGKDRTGIIVALLLTLAGVPAETVAEDYAVSDVYLRPRYEALMQKAQDEAERARLAAPKAPPERMLAVLAWLERQHGGVRPYLLHAGVTEAEIERIRARLRADT
jgi:protein tyrosine/serine phosphatase